MKEEIIISRFQVFARCLRVITTKRSIAVVCLLIVAFCFLNSHWVFGPPLADPTASNWLIYEPIVNGKLVTIEIIRVNGQTTPDRSLEKAIKNFSGYVAGKVRVVEGEQIELELGSDGALTKQQFNSVIGKSKEAGPCTIILVLLPDIDFDSTSLGFCQAPKESNGKIYHIIAINNRLLSQKTSRMPLVAETVWSTVILHELCHTLGVPLDRSHRWRQSHCTHPECVLYPRFDRRSVWAGIPHLGPPTSLCKACQREILHAQSAANDMLIDPAQPYNLLEWINKLISNEPDNTRAYMYRAKIYYDRKDYLNYIADISKVLEIDRVPKHLNRLAWILATCPDAMCRDGKRAVKLATQACELTDWKEAGYLDTLAASYAEVGDFSSAVKYQTMAISLAEENLIEKFNSRLTVFRAGKALQEPK